MALSISDRIDNVTREVRPRSIGVSDSDKPFYGVGGRNSLPAADVLFEWHTRLWNPNSPNLDGRDLDAYFEYVAGEVLRGNPVDLVTKTLVTATHAVLEADEIEGVSTCIKASRILADSAVSIESYSDLNSFIDGFYYPLLRSLLRRAGARGSWQKAFIEELSRGVGIVDILVNLPTDLKSGRCFVPVQSLHSSGIDAAHLSRSDLGEDESSEAVRKALWKLVVRARDSIANGAELVRELDSPGKQVLKAALLEILEVLVLIERRKYDVWRAPIRLSRFGRLSARMQARFGRSGLAGY